VSSASSRRPLSWDLDYVSGELVLAKVIHREGVRGDPDQEGVSDEESAANACVFSPAIKANVTTAMIAAGANSHVVGAANACVFSPAIKANVMTATIARIFFRVFIVMVIFSSAKRIGPSGTNSSPARSPRM